MPSQYSTNLRLELMETGFNTGQWGNITNTNLGQLLEQALTTQSTVIVLDSGTPTDLTSVNGSAVGDTARSLYIKLTGALTATRTVRTPQYRHLYIIENATTGAQSVSFITTFPSSVGITIPNGATALLYCDGANIVSASSYFTNIVNPAITGGSINNTTIGNITPSSGIFTNGSASTWNITTGGTLNGVSLTNATGSFASATYATITINGGTINGTTIGAGVPSTGAFTSLTSTSGAYNGTVGATTANSGAFTTISSSSTYSNTVADGSSPMNITSTTRVSNLNVARSGFADTTTITDDVASNTNFYPMFTNATSGQQASRTASTKWTFVPNAGAMTIAGPFTSASLTPVAPLATAYGGTGSTTGLLPPRVTSVASGGTITPNADTSDMVTQANTASAGTLTIAAPTGSPANGQKLIIRITCTNAQTLSFNAIYRSSTDLGFPASTTGSSRTDYLGFIYNSSATKWDMLAKVFGF
jgi:hypothetical protein